MKAKEIQDLIDFIANSGLDEVSIKTADFEIKVRRHAESGSKMVHVLSDISSAQPTISSVASPVTTLTTAQSPADVVPKSDAAASSKLITIKSPMIGTFYHSPNPDSPSFVNVGDSVVKGQVVCIIEAMKLFNEIESEVSGKIVKVLVENASPVEYDQPLFLVEPA